MWKKIKKKISDLPVSKRVQLISAIVLTIVFFTAIPVFAWFSQKRELKSITRINSPTQLYISSGHKESIANLNLADIDISEQDEEGNPVLSKSFVFCVSGNISGNTYKIQLAHTTNIPFDYRISTASEVNEISGYDVVYCSEDNRNFFYKKNSVLAGVFKNLQDGIGHSSSLVGKSYAAYTQIQKNAKPLYWCSDAVATDGEFSDYYIITVSWTMQQINNDEISNNKETDLVYITAGVC